MRVHNFFHSVLHLDRASSEPLHRQLYVGLRDAILNGQIPSETRLPSTRALANHLFVSRNTVFHAFEQLLAEGYLEARAGSGTFVSRSLPDELLKPVGVGKPLVSPESKARLISQRALSVWPASNLLPFLGLTHDIPAFQVGLPAVDAFPCDIWMKLMARRRRSLPDLLSYKDVRGYRPLRESIAAHIATTRGVRCTWEQVLITSGSQQAIDISVRMLLDPGDAAWIEEPGWIAARIAMLSAGARLIPVPVDSEGLNVEQGILACPSARLAFVTPSHQFPLGVTMSLPRRLALLDWANRAGAWIIEDDYDSDFRYTSRPLAALQGLDSHNRVIYCGTFSKVLFPSLRLGYLVAPPDLIEPFKLMRWNASLQSSAIDQIVLAEFMAEDHFVRHIRRMRALYGERQEALVDAVNQELKGVLTVEPVAAGMHVMGWLSNAQDDAAIAHGALKQGVLVVPKTLCMMQPKHPPGIMLGFSAPTPVEIRKGIRRLAGVIAKHSSTVV